MNETVRSYYEQHADEEDARLHHHAFELPITLAYIEQYLGKGDKVLDAACGTGHYLKALLKKGYVVAGNDISDKNIELSRQKTGNHKHLLFLRQGDALDTSLWESEKWDAVLLLGPEYHLIDRRKRMELLEIAGKSVKPGGYVFTGFMTRSMAMVYGLKHNPEGILKQKGVEALWTEGSDEHFIEDTEAFTQAYFVQPEEVDQMIRAAGLMPLHLVGLEGLFGERFELYHKMNEQLQKKWMEFVRKHGEEMPMIHLSKHLLSISQKPVK